ncbi:MAG: 4'-phosphopantetheinyl transferase superfamily protein [Candidatus Margulisbacteria bacterium]|nr:4'-phosphopantetheinyl transferase superfamily protein [Candidatus Margulisiibacteriota bacterium]
MFSDAFKQPLSLYQVGLKRQSISHIGVLSFFCQQQEKLSTLISQYLHPNEVKRAAQYTNDRRKQSYILGRVASKLSALQYFNSHSPKFIEIKSGIFNQPMIEYKGFSSPELSISHTNSVSTAMISPAGHLSGIDLEKVSSSKENAILSQLTPEETQIVRSSTSMTFSERLAMIWVIKEALSKTLKCGLMTPFKVLETKDLRFTSNASETIFRNFSQYKGYSWFIKPYAFGMVVPKNTEINIQKIM